MRIEELHLKNFRCFKELDIVFPKSNLAVFIGLNGAGKSAILDAIVRTLNCSKHSKYDSTRYGDKRFKYSFDDIYLGLNSGENKIDFNYKNKKKPLKIYFNKENKSIEKKYDDILEISNDLFLTYYTSNKDINYLWGSKNGINFSKFDEWFEQEENIESQIQKHKKNFNLTNKSLDVIRKATANFLSKISGANFTNLTVIRKRVYREGLIKQYNPDYNYVYELYTTFNGKELKLSQLSEGQRLLIYIVSDIAFQLVKFNNVDSIETPIVDDDDNFIDRDYKVYTEKEIMTVLESSGIVLIDEIELHLHPQWQREVLPALQKTFPNIQFIVTTHSPQVLSNLKKEEVFILKDNKISEFKPYVEGRDSNSILSEIFGVSERPKIFQDKLNEFYKAIDNQELENARKQLKKLEEYWGASDTEILKADLQLSFAEE